jgi:hypothetical protein
MRQQTENKPTTFNVKQWEFMMQYCKDNDIPPAQSWAWRKASEAYAEHLRGQAQ